MLSVYLSVWLYFSLFSLSGDVFSKPKLSRGRLLSTIESYWVHKSDIQVADPLEKLQCPKIPELASVKLVQFWSPLTVARTEALSTTSSLGEVSLISVNDNSLRFIY